MGRDTRLLVTADGGFTRLGARGFGGGAFLTFGCEGGTGLLLSPV